MLETEFVVYEPGNPNDAEEDEYTCAVQLLAKDFNRLVEMYNNDPRENMGLPNIRPFDFNNKDCRLDFVCWLAEKVKNL